MVINAFKSFWIVLSIISILLVTPISQARYSDNLPPPANFENCRNNNNFRLWGVDCNRYMREELGGAFRRSLLGFGEYTDNGWVYPLREEPADLRSSDWWDFNSEHYKVTNNGRDHGATDIAGENFQNNLSAGDHVIAISDGTVRYICRQESIATANNCEGGTNNGINRNVSRILIEHTSNNGNFIAVYGHVYARNDGDNALTVGSEVRAGNTIGYLRTYATPIHLHFGIIDPIPENGVNESTNWDIYDEQIQQDAESYFINIRPINNVDGTPPQQPIGMVDQVSPTILTVGELTEITVTGTNFPAFMRVDVEKADCSYFQRISNTRYTFYCTNDEVERLYVTVRDGNNALLTNGRHAIDVQEDEQQSSEISYFTYTPNNTTLYTSDNVSFSVSLTRSVPLVTIQYGNGLREHHMASNDDDTLWTHDHIFNTAGNKEITVRVYDQFSNGRVVNLGSLTITVSESNTILPPSLSGGVNIVDIAGGFQINSREATGDVDEYRFYRSTNNGSLGSRINTGVSRYYSDTGLTDGVIYYYTIKACNSSGCATSNQDYKRYIAPQSTKPTVSNLNVKLWNTGFKYVVIKFNLSQSSGSIGTLKVHCATNTDYSSGYSQKTIFDRSTGSKGIIISNDPVWKNKRVYCKVEAVSTTGEKATVKENSAYISY